MPRVALVRLTAAASLLVACDSRPARIDPFPIDIDTQSGPVLVGGAENDDAPRTFVVDTLSPVTLVDPVAAGEAVPVPRRRRTTLTMFGRTSAGTTTVPRVQFPETDAFVIHPCADPGPCVVGDDSRQVAMAGLIGADLLSRVSARFDFATSTLRFFPDIFGDDDLLGRTCDALLNAPFAGGGTLRLGSTDITYLGVRPAVGACLDTTGAPTDVETGVDALLLISTGIGPTILTTNAYTRYARATGAPDVNSLPAATVFLPNGPVSARLGQVGRLALVGEGSEERGPCRELFANRVMSRDLCADPNSGIGECPCRGGASFCRTAAAVDLDTPIAVAVVSDEEPLIQSLREELRPVFPEVDGLLGVEAMAPLRLELDYDNNRLSFSCLDPTNCLSRPQVRSRGRLDEIAVCLDR